MFLLNGQLGLEVKEIVSLIIQFITLLGFEKELYFENGIEFGMLLMLTTKSIYHEDYTSIKHITHDWFVQLALSCACEDSSPGLIFHPCQPAEAHPLSLTWERLSHFLFQSKFEPVLN